LKIEGESIYHGEKIINSIGGTTKDKNLKNNDIEILRIDVD